LANKISKLNEKKKKGMKKKRRRLRNVPLLEVQNNEYDLLSIKNNDISNLFSFLLFLQETLPKFFFWPNFDNLIWLPNDLKILTINISNYNLNFLKKKKKRTFVCEANGTNETSKEVTEENSSSTESCNCDNWWRNRRVGGSSGNAFYKRNDENK